MKLVLHEPEIPPNTGNVARLCAAFNVELHLIEPLGFSLENRYLKRAGLDYWPHVRLKVWPNWQAFHTQLQPHERLVLASSHGSILLQNFHFQQNDAIIMGSETSGLPANVHQASPYRVRIPYRTMKSGGVRCLNLSTAAGIFLFTALNYCGMLETLE